MNMISKLQNGLDKSTQDLDMSIQAYISRISTILLIRIIAEQITIASMEYINLSKRSYFSL